MKLLALHLRAYGPFTDRYLDLSAGNEGLHLVFGPNEAGKSSALRALKALLYGIDTRTPDSFLHANAGLRVGGRLRTGDGRELHCYRRKGRTKTLLDAQGAPLPEDSLTGFLNGVEATLFEQLFGIDHQALSKGGEALLAERGREAEALFGSGLGSARIRAVLDGLDSEAAELFVPRGSSRRLNVALAELAELRRRLRDASLPARDWDLARKAVEDAARELAEADAALAQATRRRAELERIRRILPGLARRAQLRERLATLAEAPLLPEDFGPRREAADQARRLEREVAAKAGARLTDLHKEAVGLPVVDDLLAEAERIELLRERLGSHRKAAADRPGLAARASQLAQRARGDLARIGLDLTPEDAERLRPLLGKRRRATELGGRREALHGAADAAADALAETERELAVKVAELAGVPEAPSPDALREAIADARRDGEQDRQIDEAADRLRRHEERCARELAALGLWGSDLAALRRAPLPGAESVRRFTADLGAVQERTGRLEAERTQAESERRHSEEALRALDLAGAVPSEEALGQARLRRERGWQLVRRNWQDGSDVTAEAAVYGAGRPLPEAFETAVADADEIADRLRRESQRVHDRASAQATLEGCKTRLAEIDRAAADAAAERAALERSWQDLWAPCGLSPRPPREMEDWLGDALRLRDKAQEGDALEERLESLRAARTRHRQALAQALAPLGSELGSDPGDAVLAPLLRRAESRLQSLLEVRERRTALRERIAELEVKRERLQTERIAREGQLAQWRADWGTLMGELGLAPQTSPEEVSDWLQAVADILNAAEEARILRARIAGIDADARQLEDAVDGLLAHLAPDLKGRPVEESIPALTRRLAEQRDAKTRRDALLAQARRTERERNEAQAALKAAEETLAELCRLAGCERPEQLAGAQERSLERRRLAEERNLVEDELVADGDGLGIDGLERALGAVDRDAAMLELSGLEERIERELRPRREAALERRIDAQRGFDAMAGGDDAGALAEQAEQTLASIRGYAERYVRVKLAARILRDAIETFRRRHRDPILSGTSGYFATLTCGSFCAVESDLDSADQAVLVGVRPTGERLRVEAMSTGTRDQLYLALRLATLDRYLEAAEALPFVVDDILVQFDDARTRATLDALADFSAKAQVILFTHHERVVEQARAIGEAHGRVFVHELA